MNSTSSGRTVCGASASAVAALVAFAIPGNTAYAGADDDLPTVTVSYGDLNLASSKGVESLYRRLSTAASTVCGDFDRRSTGQRAKWQECHDQALSAAVFDVNKPTLTALHSGRNGTLMTAESRTQHANSLKPASSLR
jgi:UrcA family protein